MRNDRIDDRLCKMHTPLLGASAANDPVADAVAAAHQAANDAAGYVEGIKEMIEELKSSGASQAVIDLMNKDLATAQNAAEGAAAYASEADVDYASYQAGVPSARKLVMADSANAQDQASRGKSALDAADVTYTDTLGMLFLAIEAKKGVQAMQGMVDQIQKLIDQAMASGADPVFIAELQQQLKNGQAAIAAAQTADNKLEIDLAAYLAHPSHGLVQPIQDDDVALEAQRPIAQTALDGANTIMKILAVTNPDDIGALNAYQATFAAAGLITLLQFLVDNDKNGSTDKLQMLIRAKLEELKEIPNLPTIDGTTPPVTAADWITRAENSKTKADFEWWKVSTTTTDGSGKTATVEGPIGLLMADLLQWNKDATIQPQLLAPKGDDGFYTFATSMLFVGVGARTEGSVSDFSEFMMGAEDASGCTQYFYASREIAYYLSTQTEPAGPLSTDDLKAFVDAINYKPNGNDWDQNKNPFGSQPNMYLFFYGSNGTPYDPTHDPGASPDGLIAMIDAMVANAGKWVETKGPTTPTNYVIVGADAAWDSFVNGTSQKTVPVAVPAQRAKVAAEQGEIAVGVSAPAAPAVNSDGSWPTPDGTDGALPDWFNTGVYQSDTYQGGADPTANNIGKLHRMVAWMHNHPWNKQAPLMFAQYVSTLIQDGKVQIGSPIEGYLSSLNVNGKSIIDNIIDLIVTQKFYQEQDPKWDPTNLFNNLQNLFKGDQALAEI